MDYFPHQPDDTPPTTRSLVIGILVAILIFVTVTLILRHRMKEEQRLYWGTETITPASSEQSDAEQEDLFDPEEELDDDSSKYRYEDSCR